VAFLLPVAQNLGVKKATPKRCGWVTDDPLYREYHDREWGVPSRDDRHLFEMLTLEGAQAGLSWLTILKKRDGYRRAFADWDVAKIARFSDAKQAALMQDAGIVRNRLKISSTVGNARAFLAVQKEFGSFAEYLWGFSGGKTVSSRPKTFRDLPTKTALSDAISKDMKRRGFRFVGSTIIYAYLQAIGIVEDHEIACGSKTKRGR
jgi:DNA-3-methyladenine glycosylase I